MEDAEQPSLPQKDPELFSKTTSRRKFLGGLLKTGAAVAATTPLVEFLAACTQDSQEKNTPLTEKQKEILPVVHKFNSMLTNAFGSEETVYKQTLSKAVEFTKNPDEKKLEADFLPFAAKEAGVPVETAEKKMEELHNQYRSMDKVTREIVAGYSVMFQIPETKVVDLLNMSQDKTGGSGLFLDLVESQDTDKTLALYDKFKSLGFTNPTGLPLLVERNNGDFDATVEILNKTQNYRLAMAAIKSGDVDSVLQMRDAAVRYIDGGQAEKDIASALVLAKVDSSPAAHITARNTPLNIVVDEPSGLSLNPASPMFYKKVPVTVRNYP